MQARLRTTREQVRDLLNEGIAQQDIARALSLSKSTVAYHARRLGREPDQRFNRRYDWGAIQRFYDQGHCVRECEKQFGFNRGSWHGAVKRGAIVPRPQGMPIAELLAGRKRNRNHIKLRLLRLGLKSPACEACGLSRWHERPLSLQLHHVNGDGADHRLENLQLLCPNCHSQTDTWGGRNTRRRLGSSGGQD